MKCISEQHHYTNSGSLVTSGTNYKMIPTHTHTHTQARARAQFPTFLPASTTPASEPTERTCNEGVGFSGEILPVIQIEAEIEFN